jgi:hypothetical protein
MMTRRVRLAALVVLCVVATARPARAHESRPGYLELRELEPGRFALLWKKPAQGELVLRLDPVLPEECRIERSQGRQFVGSALVARASVVCQGSLAGRTVTIAGLDGTLTDVLVRVDYLNGVQEVHLLRPSSPAVVLRATPAVAARAASYVSLGVAHIAQGIDHLLFVLGLLLIVGSGWMLLKTISAFTLAHSVTLAMATLGVAEVPAPPLNAAIALSILFLGPEIVRARSGGSSLTIRRPWLVAFAFGLLHGFGFASGLSATGLPHGEIPLALLLFNAGVELGQVAFVGLVLAIARAFRQLDFRWPAWVEALPAYAVGSFGAFWTIERTAMLLGATRT